MATRSKSKAVGKAATGQAKSKTASRSRKKPGDAAVDGAPITLEDARALARVAKPMRATRRALVAPPTPATVGAERERLQQQRRNEREQRLREYKATLAIMKERGVRRPASMVASKGRRRGTGAAAAAFQPLQVLAEGDSWFDYPFPLFGGGIVPRLEKRLGVPILNMAQAGDEVRFMLGVEQRKLLITHVGEGCPAGGPWDVVLFSGGGNDIVDNPMALWIRDWDPARAAAEHINQPRFDAALALVRAGYEDLISLRDRLSPATHLVFHAYDFAIPDGRGVCRYGPWLKPAFDLRGFPTRAAAFAVMKAMLQQFAAMLAKLAQQPKVTLIETQGTLASQTSAWHNELHPAKPGFEKFADLFQQHLKSLFPTRVL